MARTFAAARLVMAFIEATSRVENAVSISLAGSPHGYFRVRGPAGSHQVIIERYNGALLLTEALAKLPGTEERPQDTRIEAHPLGHSSGPSLSPFLWGIRPAKLAEHYPSPEAVVQAVVAELQKGGAAG